MEPGSDPLVKDPAQAAPRHKPHPAAVEPQPILAREDRRARLRFGLALASTVAALAALNLALASHMLWTFLREIGAAHYAAYHPVALQMPDNLGPPASVHGGLVFLGASTAGLAFPADLNEALIGQPAWTCWASGVRPPEMLAMAPAIVRAEPREVVLVLEARMAGRGGDSQFSRANRHAYTGLCNPAWSYRRRLDREGPPGLIRGLPMFRLGEPVRVLLLGYLHGRFVARRFPELPAWRRADAAWRSDPAQAALTAWRDDPSPERYVAYLDAVGLLHEGIRQGWADMRRVTVDPNRPGTNIEALHALTEYMRSHHVRVRWLLFPDNPMGAELRGPDGEILAPADIRPAAQLLFANHAATAGVPYLDLVDAAPADEYLDYVHLAPPGRERIAAAVRGWLAADG